MDIDNLYEFIADTFCSSKVMVEENNQIIIKPIRETKTGCCSRVRGLLADLTCRPDMPVDKFLERKHKDKELDLSRPKIDTSLMLALCSLSCTMRQEHLLLKI
jgi:hypothetical protein